MAWDFSTDPDFAENLSWIRTFVDDEILPIETVASDLDPRSLDALLDPLKAEVKRRGLWAAHLGPELGGTGMGQVKLALMHEILGRCYLAPDVFGNQAPDSGNADLLAVGAGEARKDRWLWPLLDGKLRSCFALTEPHNAGSDPTGIQTRCVQDGDTWVIDGEKWFASNAGCADFIIAMVVTDPGAQPHRRASMVVVPRDTPGLEILRNVPTMSHPTEHLRPGRAGGHYDLRFKGCRVPLDHMVGNPGDGFLLAQKRLGGGRIHHAMRMLGQCHRAFEMMCERAASRESHGKVLARHQMVKDLIAESAIEIETARLLTLKAAWKMDPSGASNSRAEIAMIKVYGARVLYNVIDRAIQVHGSLGYSSDLPVESMYRIARMFRIADGADEVHKVTIARHFLRDVVPVDGWPSEHVPTRREAALQKFGALLELRAANP